MAIFDTDRGSEKPDVNKVKERQKHRFQHFRSILDTVEAVYLKILRAAILIIGTVLLCYAGYVAVDGLYKMSRSPDSVQLAETKVAADEITNAEMPSVRDGSSADNKNQITAVFQEYYDDFVKRYYAVFQNRYEPFRQPDDKVLSQDEFDDAFLNTSSRIESISQGRLDFDADKADLESLLLVMADAGTKPATQERLKKYQGSKKIPVARKVQKTRTTQRRGWNALSTDCPNWFDPPYGCPETRTVQTPYTETVTTMEFPEGTQSHSQIFKAFQDRYLSLLHERRETNATRAERERQGILAGIVDGRQSLVRALQITGGFLVLMFFFLLIAIERHQRAIAHDPLTRRENLR